MLQRSVQILWDSSRIRPCLSWWGEWACKDFLRASDIWTEIWRLSRQLPRECAGSLLHTLSSEELITDPSMFNWRRLIEVSKGRKSDNSSWTYSRDAITTPLLYFLITQNDEYCYLAMTQIDTFKLSNAGKIRSQALWFRDDKVEICDGYWIKILV